MPLLSRCTTHHRGATIRLPPRHIGDLDDTLYPVASGIDLDIMKDIQFQDYMAEKLGVDKSGALHAPPLQEVQNRHGWAAKQCCCQVYLWRPRHGDDVVRQEFDQRSSSACADAHSCMAPPVATTSSTLT